MQLCSQHRLVTPHLDYLIKRRPVIEVLWKSINVDVRYLTKWTVLKVSIELPPLILIVSSKEACCRSFMKICQHGYGVFKKMCSFEVSIGLSPLIWIISSKEACCRSFMKICQHGYGVFKKMCSFEVSIGLLPLI